MKKQYIELLKGRRSRYALKKESPLSKEEIISLIEEVTKHTPSAFNSQSGRLVALFDKAHEDFWDLTKEEIRKVIPAGQSFAPTEKKMQAFKAAFGTVLFYEDYSVVRGLEEKFPLYKEKFRVWSAHGSAMLQIGVWTALAENGLGASLQHYDPVIDEAVRKRFEIPENWALVAQMPFGAFDAPDGEKSFQPIDERVIVLAE